MPSSVYHEILSQTFPSYVETAKTTHMFNMPHLHSSMAETHLPFTGSERLLCRHRVTATWRSCVRPTALSSPANTISLQMSTASGSYKSFHPFFHNDVWALRKGGTRHPAHLEESAVSYSAHWPTVSIWINHHPLQEKAPPTRLERCIWV